MSGTEGEDHEAGVVSALRRAVSALGAAAVAFRKLDEGTGYPLHVAAENTKRAEGEARGALRQHDAARARELRIFNKGYLAAPSPVSGTEPDTARQRVAQETLDWMDANRPGTEPDTAKLVEAYERGCYDRSRAIVAWLRERSGRPSAAWSQLAEKVEREWVERELLAGLSADAGKPEHTKECEDNAFIHHAATGGDADCICPPEAGSDGR